MENKFTDNEIIKADAWIIANYENYIKDGCNNIEKDLLGLAKRQKAEIEKYENIKTTINGFWDILLRLKMAQRKEKPTLEEFADALEEIKNEAIKEFWERLKAEKFTHKNFGELVYVEDGDNLVKEMTG